MKSLLGILFIALGIGIIFGVALPQWGKVQELREKRNVRAQIIEEINSIRDLQKELLNAYNSVSDKERENLSVILPETGQEEQLLLSFRRLAENNDMEMQSIGFSLQQGVVGAPGRVVTRIRAVGGYGGLKGFLRDIENALRLTDVTAVNFVFSDTSNTAFDITAQSYFIGPGQIPASVGGL